MNFAPKELSEKLQAFGCKSECGFWWVDFGVLTTGSDWHVTHEDHPCMEYSHPSVAAFIPQDFIGPSEQARENAKIVKPGSWQAAIACPDGKPRCAVFHSKTVFFADEFRHKLIDLPEDQFWVEIEKAVGER